VQQLPFVKLLLALLFTQVHLAEILSLGMVDLLKRCKKPMKRMSYVCMVEKISLSQEVKMV
jgi:hypothetical protein